MHNKPNGTVRILFESSLCSPPGSSGDTSPSGGGGRRRRLFDTLVTQGMQVDRSQRKRNLFGPGDYCLFEGGEFDFCFPLILPPPIYNCAPGGYDEGCTPGEDW